MTTEPLRAPWVGEIAQVFAKTPVYAVGGAVRNTLLDLPVSDVDLCGPARPEEVAAYCEGTAVTARLRVAHFGTVELHLDGHMAEYTTFRKDSYRGGHQPIAVRFADTLEEDALRRDFSVNALYTPLSAPATVLDPAGGLRHLKTRTLHTVTQDPDQVLKDDGLRILRAARFQAELGFTITDAVLASARKYVNLLDAIAPERKRDEMTKLLLSDTKYPAVRRSVPPVSAGLGTLVQVGAWGKVFPDLAPVDFSALDRLQGGLAGEKLALLYQNQTPETLRRAMEDLRFAKRDAADAADALQISQTLRDGGSKPSDALRCGIEALARAAALLAAMQARDAAKRAMDLLASVRQKRRPASIRELAVDGADLLALCGEIGMPKERIGQALSALWREAADGLIDNTRSALLTRARADWIDSQNRQ